jgi:hypothetical protein
MTAATDSAALGARLADLWSAERCDWHIDFEAGDPPQWVLTLEWTQEYGNDHQADWVTFHWLFYGETVEDALTDAAEWCEGLVPFERCGACDGDGEYGLVGTCGACGGSGLAHPEAATRGEH